MKRNKVAGLELVMWIVALILTISTLFIIRSRAAEPETIELAEEPYTETLPDETIAVIHSEEEEIPEIVETETEEVEENVGDHIGEIDFTVNGVSFHRYDLPSVYYNIDYSSFQPYMNYKVIKDRTSQAYGVVYSDNAYVDDQGMLRYTVSDSEYSINGKDDYVVALGTFYKPEGICGNRYLIVTSNGMYTVRTGDEKANRDTDSHHMFSKHGNKAGLIEWLVEPSALPQMVKSMGSVTYGNIPEVKGEILHIYSIA